MTLSDFMPWRQVPPVFRRMGRNYLVVSFVALTLAIALVALRRPLGVQREPWARFGPLALGVLPGVFMLVTWWLARGVRAEFALAHGRLCVHCAYNVASLGDSGVCPECGERSGAAADAAVWAQVGMKAKV